MQKNPPPECEYLSVNSDSTLNQNVTFILDESIYMGFKWNIVEIKSGCTIHWQLGYTKYCFFCNWDCCASASHYLVKSWRSVALIFLYLYICFCTYLHIKLGIMRNFKVFYDIKFDKRCFHASGKEKKRTGLEKTQVFFFKPSFIGFIWVFLN